MLSSIYNNSCNTNVRHKLKSMLNTIEVGNDSVYGHLTLKTPVLVRSPRLSSVEPG